MLPLTPRAPFDHAARIASAASASALLGVAAFASCILVGDSTGLAIGAALLAGAFVAAGAAALWARAYASKVRTLRERVEALGRDTEYAARLGSVAVRDEVDELQNAVAQMTALTHEPIEALGTAAEAIVEGDLTVDLRTEGNGNAAALVRKFARMRDALRQLVGDAQTSSMDVTSSAEELSAAMEEISSSIEEVSATIAQVSQSAQAQSGDVAQASHSLRETADQMQRTSREAKDAAARAREADESSAQGARNAAEASRRIQAVTARADDAAAMVRGFAENIGRISEFVKVIVRISDQTNLLALNAAIEAARAGEHGRGFTVVADEVRKLAEESARSAEEVQRVIAEFTSETNRIVATMESMAGEVKQGDDVVRQSIGRFEDVTQQVSEITRLVARMADSVDEMATRGVEIAKNVESLTASAEETAASAEEVSAAIQEQTASIQEVATTSQNLARNAAQGLESVRRFRTGVEDRRPAPVKSRPPGGEPTDMPPIFRPPPAPPRGRARVPLTRYGEESAHERAERRSS